MINLFIASFGLIVFAGIFLSIFNWLEEEFSGLAHMAWGDWIGLAIFFGIAALIAQSM